VKGRQGVHPKRSWWLVALELFQESGTISNDENGAGRREARHPIATARRSAILHHHRHALEDIKNPPGPPSAIERACEEIKCFKEAIDRLCRLLDEDPAYMVISSLRDWLLHFKEATQAACSEWAMGANKEK
jgi:hypothetical protein